MLEQVTFRNSERIHLGNACLGGGDCKILPIDINLAWVLPVLFSPEQQAKTNYFYILSYHV